MNNRDYKNFTSNTLFHIYNRGNNKEKIFADEQDYGAFLLRLGLVLGFKIDELQNYKQLHFPNSRIRITEFSKEAFKIHSFCLMPNHFHLIIEQCGQENISNLILKLCTSYAKYFNKKYSRVGHLFQDQFKAVLIESNEQLMWLSSYIHMNPVKDKLVNRPEEYEWSSYLDFSSKRSLPIVQTDLLLSIFEPKNFEKETLAYVSKGTFDI